MIAPPARRVEHHENVEVGGPATVWLDHDREGQALFIDGCRCRRRNPALALISITDVAQNQAIVLDAMIIRSLLLEGILHLEQIGKVIAGLYSDLHLDPLVVVIQDCERLVESVGHGAVGESRRAWR